MKDENHTILLNDIVEVHHDGTSKIYDLIFSKSTILDPGRKYFFHIDRQEPGIFLNYCLSPAIHTLHVDGINFYTNNKFGLTASLLFDNL